MTQCNLCLLNDLKRHAEKTGQIVTLKTDPAFSWGGGTTAYMHYENEEIDRDKHWAAWMASIPDHCMC